MCLRAWMQVGGQQPPLSALPGLAEPTPPACAACSVLHAQPGSVHAKPHQPGDDVGSAALPSALLALRLHGGCSTAALPGDGTCLASSATAPTSRPTTQATHVSLTQAPCTICRSPASMAAPAPATAMPLTPRATTWIGPRATAPGPTHPTATARNSSSPLSTTQCPSLPPPCKSPRPTPARPPGDTARCHKAVPTITPGLCRRPTPAAP